nr:zinc-ribbon domain-containing protein [Candidatus Sigynarchaeum springense]
MDIEKSKKLYSFVWLFALIDIALAAAMIVFVVLERYPTYLYGFIPVQQITMSMAIPTAGVAVVAMIAAMQGKAKVSEDEKTVFIIAILSLMFMGACAGLFGYLIGPAANTVGPLDHVITHEESDPNYALAVQSLPLAVLCLLMAIAGLGLSALGTVASILNVVNIKMGQTAARPSTSPPPSAAPKSNFCTSCGAALDSGAKFCKKCGKPV